MDYEKACQILGLDNSEYISIENLKRKYRLKALTHHPDKNKSPDASAKFQEINEAYQYLLKHLEMVESEDEDDYDDYENEFDSSIPKTGYRWVLYSFLKNIMANNAENGIFYVIIQKISNTCEKTALDILGKLDKAILIKIYEIIKSYQEAFHFSSDFFDKIENIINKRIEKDECIILNPLIDDLFENNLYKLRVNGFTYIVPLWHHELIYDHSGNDLYVKCYPMLPDNVTIDDKNNIHVQLSYMLHDIWGKECIEVALGKTKCSFYLSDLVLIEKQSLVLYSEGISSINTSQIYDVSNKSNIVLHIQLNL